MAPPHDNFCSCSQNKTELPRDLPRSDCFRKASACFRAHSPVQIFSATTIDISAFTHNQRSVQKNRGSHVDRWTERQGRPDTRSGREGEREGGAEEEGAYMHARTFARACTCTCRHTTLSLSLSLSHTTQRARERERETRAPLCRPDPQRILLVQCMCLYVCTYVWHACMYASMYVCT